MPYHPDFSSMSLKDLKRKLEGADLIPSQLPLLGGIGAKLSALGKAGIATLDDLSRALHGAKGPSALAAESGVEEDYLVVLRRTIEGFRPKPIRLADYPLADPVAVLALEALGIRDSQALYEAALGERDRAALAKKAGAGLESIEELARLSDLSRIQWVGSTFARVLHEAGYRSPAEIAAAKPEALLEAVAAANEAKKLYRGKIGLRDMSRLTRLAAELDQEMEG